MKTIIDVGCSQNVGIFSLEILCFVAHLPTCVTLLSLSATSGGGASLAWYERPGTGRCFSFPFELPESESFPSPVNWLGL